jgi:hypothetical protein
MNFLLPGHEPLERIKEIDWQRFGYQSQKSAVSYLTKIIKVTTNDHHNQ